MSDLATTSERTGSLPPAERRGLRDRARVEREKAPRKNDIVTRRNRLSARLLRLARRLAPWAIIGTIIYIIVSDAAILSAVLYFFSFAARLIVAMFYMIVQFGALFWFISRSRVEILKPEDPKVVTFDGYWGQPTLLRLVKQWISLLSDRDKFVEMGGRYINGILLYGPPGTGKTMLAKAMAGEAGIPFIAIEGSGFRGMFIGIDVLKMMRFCGQAKKLAREYGACIAYIDEIDAVGMSRGGVMGGQGGGMPAGMGMGGFFGGSGSLTRLLYEMDGIDERTRTERWKGRILKLFGKELPPRNWHVLFMGSTNRPEVLDAALLRPGRFDQKIEVNVPDKTGRRDIVKGYLSKVRCDDTINLEAIVEDTPRATPAQIAAAITKDAVRIALFDGRGAIGQRDVDQALQEQAMGIEQPIEEMDPEQRRQLAYHEAGHAVAQHYLVPEQRIVRVSIVRRGGALGYVQHVDRSEVYAAPVRRFAASIMVGLAGHVATKLHMGEYWTGAAGGLGSDFSHIRSDIWRLYSYGYFGPPVRGIENSQGMGIPPAADALIERFWRTLEEQVEALLVHHADEVEALAQRLLERADLSHAEVLELLGDNGYRPGQTRLQAAAAAGGPRQPTPPTRLPAPAAMRAAQPIPPRLNNDLPAGA
jgi:cell division protease FtsH